MGNHGAAGARARAVTAGNRAKKSTNVAPGGSRLLSLSNWPVSRRLFAVIVMALVMGLVFGGLRVASAESSASQFGGVSQLATLGQRLNVLIQDLQNERDMTLSNLTFSNAKPLAPLYADTNNAIQTVQQSTAGIGSGFPVNIQNDVATVNADISGPRITGKGGLHDTLNPNSPQDELAVIANYGAVINDMITLAGQIAQGVSDASLTSDVRAFNALALAKEQVSQQRALLNYSFSNPSNSPAPNVMVDQNTELALQIDSQQELSDESAFQTAATPAERAFLASALGANGSAGSVSAAAELETNVIANDNTVTGQSGSPLGVSILGAHDSTGTVNSGTLTQGKQTWDTGMSNDINAMQTTETQIADNIASRAGQLHSGAQQSALITGAITVAVLLLVLVAALLVARSLVLPLRRLRSGALDVASVQLPERVKQLSEAPDSAAALEVAPIDVLTEDEIGQVARAFDQVHQEAVRLAGEEALLRTSFNAMFVNLSRRSQSLQERLARMIDSLEQNEDDPDRLSNLFSMDHLVTRMRRNSENLLLLAGHEGARKWSESVSLADVARAATSEIEQYNRVVLSIQPGVSVIGQAVSDVVHLLAELVENATLYSPKDTQVQVSAQELSSGGILIEVTDKGIGVSEARLAEMNWRLDNPPTMDVSVSRHMGLFAVARLAERHRVRVRLRPASPQGLTALVWLPDSVIERTNRAVYGGTGSWQPPVGQPAAPQPVGASQGGGFQARRIPGQFTGGQVGAPQQSQLGAPQQSQLGAPQQSQPSQQSYGRHSLGARSVADESYQDSYAADRSDTTMPAPAQNGHDGVTLPGIGAGTGAGAAQAVGQVPTSNWFRSRRTPPGSGAGASRTPGGNGGPGNGGPGNGGPGNGGLGNGGPGNGGAGNVGVGDAGARPFVTAGQPGGGLPGGGQPGGGQPGGGQPGGSHSGGGGGQPGSGWGAPGAGSPGDAGTGGWPAGRNPRDIVAEPTRGEETAAGLPMRVPKANLIPGSAAGAAPGGGNGRGTRGTDSSQEAQPPSGSLPQRSPDMARSRLSGFQRGSRRAEGQGPRTGEGTDR